MKKSILLIFAVLALAVLPVCAQDTLTAEWTRQGYFTDEAYEELCDEIAEIKHVVGDRPLKVILETGLLKSAEAIRRASILSMYSGCDFIKTSTGKIYPGASLEAAYVMCQCIKE